MSSPGAVFGLEGVVHPKTGGTWYNIASPVRKAVKVLADKYSSQEAVVAQAARTVESHGSRLQGLEGALDATRAAQESRDEAVSRLQQELGALSQRLLDVPRRIETVAEQVSELEKDFANSVHRFRDLAAELDTLGRTVSEEGKARQETQAATSRSVEALEVSIEEVRATLKDTAKAVRNVVETDVQNLDKKFCGKVQEMESHAEVQMGRIAQVEKQQRSLADRVEQVATQAEEHRAESHKAIALVLQGCKADAQALVAAEIRARVREVAENWGQIHLGAYKEHIDAVMAEKIGFHERKLDELGKKLLASKSTATLSAKMRALSDAVNESEDWVRKEVSGLRAMVRDSLNDKADVASFEGFVTDVTQRVESQVGALRTTLQRDMVSHASCVNAEVTEYERQVESHLASSRALCKSVEEGLREALQRHCASAADMSELHKRVLELSSLSDQQSESLAAMRDRVEEISGAVVKLETVENDRQADGSREPISNGALERADNHSQAAGSNAASDGALGGLRSQQAAQERPDDSRWADVAALKSAVARISRCVALGLSERAASQVQVTEKPDTARPGPDLTEDIATLHSAVADIRADLTNVAAKEQAVKTEDIGELQEQVGSLASSVAALANEVATFRDMHKCVKEVSRDFISFREQVARMHEEQDSRFATNAQRLTQIERAQRDLCCNMSRGCE
ncbi:unnamed protein product [Pedinophyceae sp. YPF-701]|nr:unnamed protein product [Pedinophyceae sp. YPF-701]